MRYKWKCCTGLPGRLFLREQRQRERDFFSFQFAPHIPAAVVIMIAEVSAAITNYEVNLRAEITVWDVEQKERSLEH